MEVLSVNDNFPIKCEGKVHSGKVRSVYWLSKQNSKKIIQENGYTIPEDTPLAFMIISDRISAFDCVWKAEDNLDGVPGKGASLNRISQHWFDLFEQNELASNHIVAIPHPLVWLVQKTRPVRIEAIGRQYITGSMWRDYAKGVRKICGQSIPNGLENNQKLPELLITPSTKGIIRGLDGVPAIDDVNISRKNIIDNLATFQFNNLDDVDNYENLLQEGFKLIGDELAKIEQIFVDTKFEFGYSKDKDGNESLIYIDEVGTPDSSRIWDEKAFKNGKIVENSKEGFRQALLNHFPNSDILLDKSRMKERVLLAKKSRLPKQIMLNTAKTYQDIAEKITGQKIAVPTDPREEILDSLAKYKILK